MPVTVKSLSFLERLQKMKATAQMEDFTVTLSVPDELFWWIFLEFGTGVRGDNPTEGYTITPKTDGGALHFFDVVVGEERFAKSVYMPGIPAFHMITSIYADIQAYQKDFIQQSLKSTGFDLNATKELVYAEMMPKIKEMIIDSFQENLPNHHREFGRLQVTATQAFEEGLEVV